MSSRLFFTSDLHLGHGNIVRYCRRLELLSCAARERYAADPEGFRATPEEVDAHDAELIDRINERVREGDELRILGDFSMRPRARSRIAADDYCRKVAAWRARIRCRVVHLVAGNHDLWTFPNDLGFATVRRLDEVRVGRVTLTLCHYPMLTWNRRRHGRPRDPVVHLHGHVHSRDPLARPAGMAPEFFASWAGLDVGVDGHDYRPWALEEILEALRPRLEAAERLKVAGAILD